MRWRYSKQSTSVNEANFIILSFHTTASPDEMSNLSVGKNSMFGERSSPASTHLPVCCLNSHWHYWPLQVAYLPYLSHCKTIIEVYQPRSSVYDQTARNSVCPRSSDKGNGNHPPHTVHTTVKYSPFTLYYSSKYAAERFNQHYRF